MRRGLFPEFLQGRFRTNQTLTDPGKGLLLLKDFQFQPLLNHDLCRNFCLYPGNGNGQGLFLPFLLCPPFNLSGPRVGKERLIQLILLLSQLQITIGLLCLP